MAAGDVNVQDAFGAERDLLAGEIADVISRGVDGPAEAFERLAPRVFAFQYAHNEPYRAYCDVKGATPATVDAWEKIPAFPTAAFKKDVVASFPLERAVMAQLTSGTTSANQRGRIFRDEVGRKLVFSANREMTGAYLFPDFEAGRRCRILILAPSPQMAPSMGMAIGMEQTRAAFGTDDSAFMLEKSGIDVARLVKALRESEGDGVPIALIGSTSAFIYFLKACERKGLSFRLPEGTRIGDGGGYRGRFGEVTREGYYELAERILGVRATHCVNILGMAESATNYFDHSLRASVLGLDDGVPRHKIAPPWTRVQAVSVDDLSPLPHGEVGLLRHFDIANLPTVLAVQSDNLGFTDGRGGFEIVGRAKVVDGRVTPLPSERAVGPMGDNRVFRLLESYVNFSIDFKMSRLKADPADTRAEVEMAGEGAVPSCPTVVDDIVAGADDGASRASAEEALQTFYAAPPDVESPDTTKAP